jgi:putative sterol carrier protein
MSELAALMNRFVECYHARSELVAEQCGWDCTIILLATDSREHVAVRVEDGRAIEVHEREEQASLVVSADHQTLCDILELRRGPNEPYLFGELTVQGAEADFVRLDYITECLCPQ